MAGWKVEVTGLRELVNALQETDKAALRSLTKRITDAGKRVVAEASYIVPGTNPISGWGKWVDARTGRDLSYEPATVSASFKLRRNNYRRRGVSAGVSWDVYQTNAGGAIYELLGSGTSQFVDSVAGRYTGKQPRALIPAYYSGFPESTRQEIADDILDAARRAGLV